MKKLLLFISLSFIVASSAVTPRTSNSPRIAVGDAGYAYYGTASAPAITSIRDKNTGISFTTADTISFATGGTNRLDIDSTGLSADDITVDDTADLDALKFGTAAALSLDAMHLVQLI